MDNLVQVSASDTEKKRRLFLMQKETLDILLQRGAITQAQYDKSLGDLAIKMGIGEAGLLRSGQ